jgi:hypothetical protein
MLVDNKGFSITNKGFSFMELVLSSTKKGFSVREIVLFLANKGISMKKKGPSTMGKVKSLMELVLLAITEGFSKNKECPFMANQGRLEQEGGRKMGVRKKSEIGNWMLGGVLCVFCSAISRNRCGWRRFCERGGAPTCSRLQATDHTKPAASRRSALVVAWPRCALLRQNSRQPEIHQSLVTPAPTREHWHKVCFSIFWK